MITWLKVHSRLASLVAAAVFVVVGAAALPQLTQGEEPMATATTTSKVAIPQIDTDVPAVTETATFAMG
jgi:hypothetical protein